MKAFFEIPEVEIILLAENDVISTSGPLSGGNPGDDEGPDW